VRVIIAGSRTATRANVDAALKSCPFSVSLVLSGCARGADTFGEMWATERGVPVEVYPADWKRLGKRAGVIRNEQMAERADALVAVWDGESRGTQHMIETAKSRGLLVHIHKVQKVVRLFGQVQEYVE
jgi:hypothetical protein